MKAFQVDEAALGEFIIGRRSQIVPLAFLFLIAFIAMGNQWLGLALAAVLALAYRASGWDGGILVIYGAGCLIAAAPLLSGGNPWQAGGILQAGYWLLASGAACMAADFIAAMGNDGQGRGREGRPGAGHAEPA